ncbi:uncharacterized protein LOC100374409 [Saccoglossus kowalevskii]|uniref:Ankyrin-3-like n=1 Tax=Saccoglossus kowalevskii TaxID=10224 RepID=A0ABM0M0Y7_SACKO|nr:PREDICTED: ankyrin-3-like [Saccoglossus kowalevskii]
MAYRRYSRYRISPENPQVLLDKGLVEETKNGNIKEVAKLLEMGASVDATCYIKALFYASENYMSPLMYAASLGYTDILKLLLNKGADPCLCDRFDVTATHWAAEKGHVQCIKLLLDNGANPSIATKYSKPGCYTAVPHRGGTTPLHLAARYNNSACIKELIDNGADYNAQDELGMTSLYIASHAGHEEAVLIQLQNAIGKDILSLPVKYSESTPLHECVQHKMFGGVKELLRHGSDVNHHDTSGLTPLHYGICQSTDQDHRMVELLVSEGHNVDLDYPTSSAVTEYIKSRMDRSRNMYDGLVPLQLVVFNAIDETNTRSFLHRHGLLINHNAQQPGEQQMQLVQNPQLPRRRSKVAAFLIAYGANYDILLRPNGKRTLLQNEIFSVNDDYTVLNAIVRASDIVTVPEALPIFNIVHDQERIAEYNIMKEKYDWLKNIAHNPQSLQHLCRYKIRQCMGKRRLKFVKNLPLPVTLKDFLMLKY